MMKYVVMCAAGLCAALAAGCDGRGNVLMTGTITAWSGRDTMYVTLTRNWEQIRMAPKRFMVQPSGYFELEFTVGRNPPPVTFIKNNSVYAVLTLRNLWDESPVVIDETRNTVFDVRCDNGQFFVKLTL